MSAPDAKRPLVVIRPEPGNAATCAAARALGLEPSGVPLFDIAPLPWQAPRGLFDAILAGSANVFRHGGDKLPTLRAIPVIAVGSTTAQAARNSGFAVSRVGEGGLQPVVADLPPGTYLRIAGEDRVELTPPEGVRIETVVAYAACRLPFPPPLATLLHHGAVILLHSGEAARHFAAQCETLGIPKQSIHLACLAPRIAELAGPGWASVSVASGRTDPELLELGRRMCQTV